MPTERVDVVLGGNASGAVAATREYRAELALLQNELQKTATSIRERAAEINKEPAGANLSGYMQQLGGLAEHLDVVKAKANDLKEVLDRVGSSGLSPATIDAIEKNNRLEVQRVEATKAVTAARAAAKPIHDAAVSALYAEGAATDAAMARQYKLTSIVTGANAAEVQRVEALKALAAAQAAAAPARDAAMNRLFGEAPRATGAEISELTAKFSAAKYAVRDTTEAIGLNRQGFLELEAAGVNTMQALASGMNPYHVAVMESAQVLGGLVQGGIIPTTSVISGLQAGFAALLTPVGAVTAGISAAAVAFGVMGLRAYEANLELAQLHSTALLQGRQASQVEDNARAMASQVAGSGGLGRGESRALAITIQALPEISPQAREDLKISGEALARHSFGGDVYKASEFIEKTFGSVSGIKAFADTNRLVSGDIKEQLDAAISVGDAFRASEIAAAALRKQISPTIEDLAKARDSLGWLGRNLDIFGQGFELALKQATRTRIDQVTKFREGPPGPTTIESQADKAIEARLRTERELTSLIDHRRDVLAALEVTQNAGRRATLENARAEIDRSLSVTRTPLEEEAHRIRLANLESELQKAQQAASRDISLHTEVLAIRKRIEDEIAEHTQGSLAKIEGAAQRESAARIVEAQKTHDAIIAMEQALLQQQLSRHALTRAESPTDPRVQLREAQKEMEELLASGVASADQIRSKNIEIVGLEKQVVNYVQAATTAQLQQSEAIAQARGNLAAVVDLRRQEAALIQQNKDSTDAAKIAAQTRIIQSQIQAQQQSVRISQQAVEAENRFAGERLQTTRSLLDLQVTQGSISKESAIRSEMAITRSVMDQQQARLKSFINTANLQETERAALNERLASLYEQDAQKQIDLQKRLTEAVRQENEKRVQNIKNFLEATGDAAGNLLIAGITRSQTKEAALKQFADSVMSSFTKEAMNATSKLAGKGLANVLDVKLDVGEDSTIGAVLTKKLGSVFGLTEDKPKSAMEQVAPKLELAATAHKEAAALWSKVAQEFSAAANKAPYLGGVSTTGAVSTGGTDVAALVRKHESRDNYNVGYGGADLSNAPLNEYGFPIWAGKMGPAGISHAAGAYQFQPATWERYAKPLGVTDFSAASQDRVFQAAYAAEGMKPWQSNAPLMAAIQRLDSTTQGAAAAQQQGTTAITESASQSQRTVVALDQQKTATDAEKAATDAQKTAVDQNTQALKSPTSGAAKADGGAIGTAASGIGIDGGLSLLTKGFGIAASAAAVFGTNLSTTSRTILGTIGVITQLSSLLSTVGAASAAGSAVGGVGSVLGGIGSAFSFISGLFFQRGGVVPSAAGGMLVPGSALAGGGQISILHPNEMVLPADLSATVQNAARARISPRNTVLGEFGPGSGNLPLGGSAGSTTTNAPIFNYNGNVTGYHPYGSRSQFESMLRQHGGAMQSWVENMLRNGNLSFTR